MSKNNMKSPVTIKIIFIVLIVAVKLIIVVKNVIL